MNLEVMLAANGIANRRQPGPAHDLVIVTDHDDMRGLGDGREHRVCTTIAHSIDGRAMVGLPPNSLLL